MFETPRAFSVDVRTPWKEVTQIPEFYFKIRLSLSLLLLRTLSHIHTRIHFTHSITRMKTLGAGMKWSGKMKSKHKVNTLAVVLVGRNPQLKNFKQEHLCLNHDVNLLELSLTDFMQSKIQSQTALNWKEWQRQAMLFFCNAFLPCQTSQSMRSTFQHVARALRLTPP